MISEEQQFIIATLIGPLTEEDYKSESSRKKKVRIAHETLKLIQNLDKEDK